MPFQTSASKIFMITETFFITVGLFKTNFHYCLTEITRRYVANMYLFSSNFVYFPCSKGHSVSPYLCIYMKYLTF